MQKLLDITFSYIIYIYISIQGVLGSFGETITLHKFLIFKLTGLNLLEEFVLTPGNDDIFFTKTAQ